MQRTPVRPIQVVVRLTAVAVGAILAFCLYGRVAMANDQPPLLVRASSHAGPLTTSTINIKAVKSVSVIPPISVPITISTTRLPRTGGGRSVPPALPIALTLTALLLMLAGLFTWRGHDHIFMR